MEKHILICYDTLELCIVSHTSFKTLIHTLDGFYIIVLTNIYPSMKMENSMNLSFRWIIPINDHGCELLHRKQWPSCTPHNTDKTLLIHALNTHLWHLSPCIQLLRKRKWFNKGVIHWERWHNKRIAWCHLDILDIWREWIAICSVDSPEGKYESTMYGIIYLHPTRGSYNRRIVWDTITRMDSICKSVWFVYHLYLLLLCIVDTERASHTKPYSAAK